MWSPPQDNASQHPSIKWRHPEAPPSAEKLAAVGFWDSQFSLGVWLLGGHPGSTGCPDTPMHMRKAVIRFCVLWGGGQENGWETGWRGCLEKGEGEEGDMIKIHCKYVKLLRNKKIFLRRKTTKQVAKLNKNFITLQGSQLSNKPLLKKKVLKNVKKCQIRMTMSLNIPPSAQSCRSHR